MSGDKPREIQTVTYYKNTCPPWSKRYIRFQEASASFCRNTQGTCTDIGMNAERVREIMKVLRRIPVSLEQRTDDSRLTTCPNDDLRSR